ncbi:MAG: SDR family NAD(P)-dependent oxidoreductase [Saccharofermentanales bacterium]
MSLQVEAFDRKAVTYECDVTDEQKVKETVEQIIKDFGKIDILLNNAGIGVGGESPPWIWRAGIEHSRST